MLALLRCGWLAIATLVVVLIVGWAGTGSWCRSDAGEDVVVAADPGNAGALTDARGQPSMQEEDDEVHADVFAPATRSEAALRAASWPELVSQRRPTGVGGERPPHTGPPDRPPHA